MIGLKNDETEDQYWSKRYEESNTGWDIGYPSLPLKAYIDQLDDRELKILIPGAGNAYEAEYLFNEGFKNVFVLDVSSYPLESFKKRVPNFPEDQLIKGDFFDHKNQYDLILEQTFFCSFDPTFENRSKYAQQVYYLLKDMGKLVGLWFKHPLKKNSSKRPFGGSKEEYLSYFQDLFDVVTFEDCYNSIKPRMGNELFGIFSKG